MESRYHRIDCPFCDTALSAEEAHGDVEIIPYVTTRVRCPICRGRFYTTIEPVAEPPMPWAHAFGQAIREMARAVGRWWIEITTAIADSFDRTAERIAGETRRRRSAWASEDQSMVAFAAIKRQEHPEFEGRIETPDEWVSAFYDDYNRYRWALRRAGILQDGV